MLVKMSKENMALDPTGRITRARAAAYHASGGMLPPKPCTRQTQKCCLGGNSKRPALENSFVPVTEENKRRAVLKDVTNVLCENSYKSCMNASKIQGKLEDGREIAVKKLSQTSNQGKKEFMNEAKLLARVQHRNVVNLLGYCTHGSEKLLVYEYLLHQSLDKFLFNGLHTFTKIFEYRIQSKPQAYGSEPQGALDT